MNIDPKLIPHLPDPELLMELASNLRTITLRGTVMQKQLSYSDELMEKLYAVGYKIYEKGRFRDALEFFENLFYLNPLDYKICYSAAAAAQRMGDWYRAILYYAYAAAAQEKAPEPSYFSAECCVQIGKEKAAIKLYEKAVEKCGNRPEYQELKERCQVLERALAKRIQEGKVPLCVEAQSVAASSR